MSLWYITCTHIQVKDWVMLFLSLSARCEGFQKKNVTPYMHCLVYHVPAVIKNYGNLKQFSNIWVEWVISYHVVYTMTGVEKNNDDAWRNYFSSNLHDPAGKILKAEIRSEYTELYKRVKRQYNKRWWLLAKWWNWGQQKEATNRITCWD